MERKQSDQIETPKLNMSRALGDFWSRNPKTGQYAVSPVPDVLAVQLHNDDRFIIFVSDGVTSVLQPKDLVEIINNYNEKKRDRLVGFLNYRM